MFVFQIYGWVALIIIRRLSIKLHHVHEFELLYYLTNLSNAKREPAILEEKKKTDRRRRCRCSLFFNFGFRNIDKDHAQNKCILIITVDKSQTKLIIIINVFLFLSLFFPSVPLQRLIIILLLSHILDEYHREKNKQTKHYSRYSGMRVCVPNAKWQLLIRLSTEKL